MCTRFYADLDKELKPFVDEAQQVSFAEQMMTELSRPLSMSGEIRPTDIAAVIAPSRNGQRAVFPMQWGFSINGLKTPIVNARIESAADKPTFRDSWYRRRCVIPASWYYEWQHYKTRDGRTKTGEKYAIQPKDSEITWLAGLYRFEEKGKFRYPVFVVLTQEPCKAVSAIHDRMPVILPESAIDDWISVGGIPEETIKSALSDVTVEKA